MGKRKSEPNFNPKQKHHKCVHIQIFSSSRMVNRVPEDIWQYEIIPYLDLRQFANLRCHSSFNMYWHVNMAQNVIRVPQGCPTVEKAMALAVIFSERKEYTEADPLKIRLEEGVHEIVGVQYSYGSMNVTCSHITFVGKGKSHTTIRGGFKVNNQQNVTFEELAIMNQSGNGAGLYLEGSETNVDVRECCFKKCRHNGMGVGYGATATATRCEFMENSRHGVYCNGANTKARLNDCTMHHNGAAGLNAWDHAVVDLHGTKTGIHSNKRNGIYATSRAKVNIHLPSQHNTSHDNIREDRENGWGGGSIANINADGTFTHVVADEE